MFGTYSTATVRLSVVTSYKLLCTFQDMTDSTICCILHTIQLLRWVTTIQRARKRHTGIHVDVGLYVSREDVLLLVGLGHVRWAELKERCEKANIPLIELVPVVSKDCEKNLFEINTNKSTNRNLSTVPQLCLSSFTSISTVLRHAFYGRLLFLLYSDF